MSIDKNSIEKIIQDIWQKEIVGDNSSIKKSEHPQAFVLGGQPGAGKSNLAKEICKNLHDNVVEINGDLFRKYHPDYQKFIENNPLTMPEKTAEFSATVTQEILKKAIKEKYNVVIEGTFRTSETPTKTLKLFKNNKYKTNVLIQSCDKNLSWQSCMERYEKGKKINPKEARYTDKKHHDLVVKNLIGNVKKVQDSGLADNIKIFIRKGDREMKNEEVYDSEKGKLDVHEVEKNINPKNEFEYEFGEIKITSTDEIGEPFKSKLKKDIFFKGDDAIAVLQTLKSYDDFVKNKNLSEHKFPNEKISLELKNGDHIDTLNVKLGEGNFDSLEKLIKSSKIDLTKENKINQTNYADLLKKKVDLDKIFDGGVKSLEVVAEALGDETTKEFIQGFSATMNALKKFQDKNATEDKEIDKKEKTQEQEPEKKKEEEKKQDTKEKINDMIDKNFQKDKQDLQNTNKKVLQEGKIDKIKEKSKEKIKHKTILEK